MNAPTLHQIRSIYVDAVMANSDEEGHLRAKRRSQALAEFAICLRQVKSEARADGYSDGHDDGLKEGWEVGYESGREGAFSQMPDREADLL